MPRLEPRRPPPPDYYADNLEFLIEQVRRRSADLLAAPEHTFLAAWDAAGSGARRLFARLLTRKGPWFRADRLVYAEVPDTPAALAELERLGLVRICPPAPADALLELHTRAELAVRFPTAQGRGGWGNGAYGKRAWIDACVARYSDAAIRARLRAHGAWLDVAAADAYATCRLLFFGSDRQDLSDFVLQDLGVIRFERYQLGPQTRPFASRRELLAYQACRRMERWLGAAGDDAGLAAAIRRRLWAPADSRTVAHIRDGLLNRLGQAHERRREFDAALESYALSGTHPARERRARILQRLGDSDGHAALVARIAAAPWSAAEEDYARRAAPAGCSAAPDDGPLRLDVALAGSGFAGSGPGAIERHALDWLAREGHGTGWHLENHLPLGLAGLAFWAEIFAPVAGAFTHPLQQGPRDLFWPDFARARAESIATRAGALAGPGAFRAQVAAVYAAKHGIANRLVHWDAWTPTLLDAVLAASTRQPILALAEAVIRDPARGRTGFPDLTLVDPHGRLVFVEVKGPTDQLQPAQRTWLRTLARLGLPARVLQFR